MAAAEAWTFAAGSGSAEIAARLDRLPMTRCLWLRVILISLGGFFEFYDLLFTGYIAPGLVRSGILTPTTAGLFGTTGIASFVAAFFAGLFVGTILFGFTADKLGRRAVFTASLLFYTAASVVMALQTDAFGLNLWRFLAGIGVGVENVTIDTYIAELVPGAYRGRAFALSQGLQFSAVPVVAFLAWRLVPIAPLGLDGWRWVVLIGASGAVVVWWVRLKVPESPRWLASHGHIEQAEVVMRRIEAGVEADTGRPLPSPSAIAASCARGRFAEIWQGKYLPRTIMMMLFNALQAIGFYGFSNWVPTLLIAQGIAVTTSLQYTFIIAIAAPFGPWLATLAADKAERKWLLVAAALSVGLFGLAFGQFTSASPLILFGVLTTLANNTMSSLYHTYQAELFPTRVRAMAVGFVYSWSRLSTVFSAFLIAFFLGHLGTAGVFAFIAGSMALAAAAIAVLGPPTSRRALEDIAH